MKSFEQYKKTVRFLSILILDFVLTSIYGYVWQNKYNIYFDHPFRGKGIVFTFAAYFAVMIFVFMALNLHKIDEKRAGENIFSGIISVILVNAIAYVQISLVEARLSSISPLLLLLVAQTIVTAIWAKLASELIKKLDPPQRMVIIYGSHLATEIVVKMCEMVDKYTICESVNISDGFDRVVEAVKKYDSVIICDVPARMRNDILKYCYAKNKKIYIVPKISDVLIRGSNSITYFDSPLLCCDSIGLTLEQRILKRAADIVISTLGIIILSPLLLVISAAIKLYDRGPVFYRQKRITINERHFYILKFRSMIVNAEKDGIPLPAVDNDSRITPVGRIIRKLRMDELPQLFNIFIGDMSVVGPRPERIEHVKKYSDDMPEFLFRYKVKGGLTGYAQIFGKYNTSPYNKLKLDLMYIQNYSFMLDIKLILMTFKVLFKKESTEGFDR